MQDRQRQSVLPLIGRVSSVLVCAASLTFAVVALVLLAAGRVADDALFPLIPLFALLVFGGVSYAIWLRRERRGDHLA